MSVQTVLGDGKSSTVMGRHGIGDGVDSVALGETHA